MVMHFSVDDFIEAFLDIRDGAYSSVFEQPTFALLKRIHESCGAVFSLYCFGESKRGSLAEVPDTFVREFQENAAWLRFGFHAWNGESNYGSRKFSNGEQITDGEMAARHYESVIEELVRITGGGECIDRCPRIHYYAGTLEDCHGWKLAKYGVFGLITAEDDRVCYYHDETQWRELLQKGYYWEEQQGIHFYRTCIRLENVKDGATLEDDLKMFLASEGADCIIFTHEKFLKERRIEEYFLKCGKLAEASHVKFGYLIESEVLLSGVAKR